MKLVALLSVLLSSSWAQAEWNLRQSFEAIPQYRKINQQGFSDKDHFSEFFFLYSPHLEWNHDRLQFEIKPEVRGLFSQGVGSSVAVEANSVRTSDRVLDSRRMLWRSSDSEAYVDLDRLNLRYTLPMGEAFIGRRPLSLGVLRFFPVWNKLTLPLIFQPGPEWIENPDVLGASAQLGRFSYRAFAGRGDRARSDDLVLAEVRYFGDQVEVQGLAGSWWEHPALGLASAFDVMQSTLRFESLWLGRHEETDSQVQVGVGVERALSAKWTLVTEALYQSAGLSDMKNTSAPPNRFMPLSSRYYLLPYLTYQFNALWMLHGGFLAGLADDASGVALAGFEHSVSDNSTLTLKVKWPVGSDDGEFGAERIEDPFGRTMGAPATALLQFQSTF